MQITIWLFSLMLVTLAVVSQSSAQSSTPQYPSPDTPRAGYYPSSSQRPVYTAQRSRDSPANEDDDPYPSTSFLGTAQTTNGAEEPENTGFVNPIDFKNILRDVESSSKSLDQSASNPLFASESKNSFSGFFGADNTKDPFSDFGGGGLATASSERSQKNGDIEDSTGFVDPNVNFRSLFDSSQTASNGFKPEDFLESTGTESTRDSPTQAFPSFTYSGRKDDDQPNRFRSSYRGAESQDDDYGNDNNDNYRGRDDRERDYNDSPSYRERASSPPSRYNNEGPRHSPTTEETSHRPQSTGRSPKTAESKNNPKCKKVEKTVDYQNDDYNGFTEPEPDYDPSTYRGRYKRQSRQGRQSRGNKRPMTCYVCEDEQGRYAERCSYDSNANPKKGEYFHSSSSSFRDDGRRPSGKQDRHRRNPYVSRKRLEASPTTLSTVLTVVASKNGSGKSPELEHSQPKVIEKRQSGSPNRYASNFGNNGPRNGNRQRGEFDYEANPEYDLPRGYIGRNGGRVEEFDSPQYQPSDSNSDRGQRGGGDDFGFGGGNRNNNDRDFGFGGSDSSGTDFNDFNFGPPTDFGREASPSGSNDNSGFNFDFSIPKDFDPDVQLRNSNNGNTNRPNIAGSASNNPDESLSFNSGYDDYVKRNFPESFGPPSSPEASTRSSFKPSAGPPINHDGPSYRPRPREHERANSFNQHRNNNNNFPSHNHNRGNQEETQPSHNFAPPPNFYDNGPQEGFHAHGGDDDEIERSPPNLNNMVNNFSGRDRSGCQKIQKGDMSCYVCRDSRGMNKEECMYASNDPKNQRMAYHEVTEYSSDPPASFLPAPPKPEESQPTQAGSAQAASVISAKTVESPSNKVKSPKSKGSSITRVESTVVTRKVHHENNSPVEYDFDY